MSLLTKTSHRRHKPSKKPAEATKDTVKSPTSDISVSDDSGSQPEEVNFGRRSLHDSSSSFLNHLEEASTGSSIQDFGLVGSSSYDSFDSISIMSSSSSSVQPSLAQRRDLASLDLAGARSIPGAAKKAASTAAASASSFKPLTTTFEVTREDLDLGGGTLEDDEVDGELGGLHPDGSASDHAPATKSIINPHDRLATLDETLRLVPSEVGFVIEVKYPAERFQIAEKMRYAERNAYADAVLNSVFNAMKNPQSASRKIMLISFDPDLCVLLSQKQPRFPVFFLLALGNGVPVGPGDDEIEGYDPRCQSIEMAIKFAKNVRLQGIICDAKTVLKSIQSAEEASTSSLTSSSSSTPTAMSNGITPGGLQTPTPSPTSSPSPAQIPTSSSFPALVHEAGLMLMTYGAENMDAEKRQIQKSAGVDSLIMDNVVHINREVRKRKQMSSLFLADYGRQNFKLAPAAPTSTST
jgi:glycerophosphoryl diester phosphodiesterase